MQLGIQLYTLRALDETVTETIDRIAGTRYSGVQFAGLDSMGPGDLRELLDKTGLDDAGAHIGLDAVESEYDRLVDQYGELGVEDLVVSSYGSDAFETREGAIAAGEHLASAAEKLAADGFSLHYHNHTYEFTELDGDETTFDVFAEAAEGVGLEIDTGLANFGGADPVDLLERYAERVDLIHLTDSHPDSWDDRHCDLGDGTVDIEACVEAGHDGDAEWLIFEHGVTDNPLRSTLDAEEYLAPLVYR